jgi:hypothetical protein
VMFPPGWLSPGTMPLATGSTTFAKTIGIVVGEQRSPGVPFVTMMSGRRPTNSCASTRIRLMSSPVHRTSIRRLRPSVQPKAASACVKAEKQVFRTGSFSSPGLSQPMRRIRSPCCARTASGHAAAPLRSVIVSRRLMRAGRGRGRELPRAPPHRSVRAAFPHTAPTSGV